MNVKWPKVGVCVLAVSGGVDSMTLLDLMASRYSGLVVAHFDHGIRDDSSLDRLLVSAAADGYGLKFRSGRGQLGPGVSEDQARQARYRFLESARRDCGAEAIVTAHHQDDLIETAFINLLRGTGRLGLTALSSNPKVIRPLLNVTKAEIKEYATEHKLKWREDSTNSDLKYLRNYLRAQVLSKLSPAERRRLVELLNRSGEINSRLDQQIKGSLSKYAYDGSLKRDWFVSLPYPVASEVMAAWLRSRGVGGFNRKVIDRLVIGAKVASAGKMYPIVSHHNLIVSKEFLALDGLER